MYNVSSYQSGHVLCKCTYCDHSVFSGGYTAFFKFAVVSNNKCVSKLDKADKKCVSERDKAVSEARRELQAQLASVQQSDDVRLASLTEQLETTQSKLQVRYPFTL